jgi:SAM-dependent methyltransferase
VAEEHGAKGPDSLLTEHLGLFAEGPLKGPVLDLACGDGHNGIYLATKGLAVVLADASGEALGKARRLAEGRGLRVSFWQVDLEGGKDNPLQEDAYGAILVFRYLHRPLIPCIRKALTQGGLLMYETFTVDQRRFGRPRNPDFLLKPGELKEWFKQWQVIHSYEGIRENPERAVAQIVCRKPEG